MNHSVLFSSELDFHLKSMILSAKLDGLFK